MNITAAFNKTSIVWQDVFDYHKRVSSPVPAFGCVMHVKYFNLLLVNTQSNCNEYIYMFTIYVLEKDSICGGGMEKRMLPV